MKKNENFSFYTEVIVMLLALIMVIMTLTRVFAGSRGQSSKAAQLSDAVILASNGAEIMASCGNEEELMEILKDAAPVKEGTTIRAYFDENFRMDPNGVMELAVDWQEENDFVHAVITVSRENRELYQMTTGVYLKGDRP
ncbi:MAG: hypothetical protein IJ120_02960 [Solobacterium sp.]|nr:hypothetical protein [Solobacterium sp.]